MDVCAICLEDLDGVAEATTSCGHLFHTRCICRATRTSNACPICRAQICDPVVQPAEAVATMWTAAEMTRRMYRQALIQLLVETEPIRAHNDSLVEMRVFYTSPQSEERPNIPSRPTIWRRADGSRSVRRISIRTRGDHAPSSS